LTQTVTTTEPSEARRRLTAPQRRAKIEDAATRLFGQRGYSEAPIDEIARLSGITPPVLYEHFPSKLALYEAVLQSRFAELRAIWQARFAERGFSTSAVVDSVETWFGHVEANPAAARLLFREPAAPEAAEVHRGVSEQSRDLVLGLLAREPGAERLAGSVEQLEMTWVVLRGVLQGLALWWVDHPGVSRKQVVEMAINSIWRGFERTIAGREP
jgi:AcrR family transcriptional regulator